MLKQNKNLVSVIIPFYNSKKFLERAIISVINQSYKKLEIILVDDCSTDGSDLIARKFLKKDIRIKIIKTKKNSGAVGLPRNLGIKKSIGQYVSFLDSDDYWEKNKIELQMRSIKNKDLICTACYYENYKNKIKSGFILNYLRLFVQLFFFKKIKNHGHHWLYVYNPIIVSSVLIKRNLFKYINFDEENSVREDLSLWLKLFKKINKNFIFLSNKTLTITRFDESMSSNKIQELAKIIKTTVSDLIDKKFYDKLGYILIGTILRIIKFFLSFYIKKIRKYLALIIITTIMFYTCIFYSPLFWNLGNSLLYNSKDRFDKIDTIISYSGNNIYQNFDITFRYRYEDIKRNYSKDVKKIYLIGRLNDLPNQNIIKKLLIASGVEEKKIEIYLENFQINDNSVKNLFNNFIDSKSSNIAFTTIPYTTVRLKESLEKNTLINFKILKSYEWPEKNKMFEYSKNKKIILSEYYINFKTKITNMLKNIL